MYHKVGIDVGVDPTLTLPLLRGGNRKRRDIILPMTVTY
jgi:hypothetical protein